MSTSFSTNFVATQLEGLHPMRLEIALQPNAANGGFADGSFLGRQQNRRCSPAHGANHSGRRAISKSICDAVH